MSLPRSSLPSEVRVRRARIEDAATLAALGARTFADAYRELIPEEELGCYVAQSFSLEQIRGELGATGSTFLIAERETDAVGYARLLEQAPPGVDAATRATRLVRIYVDQSRVRGGVGSLLMQACLEQARPRGRESLWLRVWEENRSAIAFYEKWRFAKVGTLEFDMLGEVRTDWIMQVGADPE